MPRTNAPEVPVGHKWCAQCSTAQPRQRFTVDRSRPDGRAYACRRCVAAKQRARAARKAMFDATYARLYPN